MSDQNLEYTLDVDIAAAERKLKSLFGDMETSMDILGKAVGKKLKGALTEQEQSAREFGRQLTALDRAVQSNFGLVEKLTDKYASLGNTKLNGLIGQLEQLTKSSISPELQKLMDNRAATPAGVLKAETGDIRDQIDAELAAIANRKAAEKQEAADFVQLQKMKRQAASQRLKEDMDAEIAAAKNRKAQDIQQAADFVAAQKIKHLAAAEALQATLDAEVAARANRKAAEQQEIDDFIAAQKIKKDIETQRLKEAVDAAALAAANRKAQDEQLAADFVEAQRLKREALVQSQKDAEVAESQRLKAVMEAAEQEKQLLDRLEKEDIQRLQQKRAREKREVAEAAKNNSDYRAAERALLDEWERRDTATSKQRRLRLKDEDSEEAKSLRQRIENARSLAVETGKYNEEKFGKDQAYRTRVQAIYAQLDNDYEKLMVDSVGMTAEAVSAKIQLLEKGAATEKAIAVNAAQERAIETAKVNASLGRFSSNLYMVQQTVEDFSYAGLRGATNNLAFMASTIAGPAGTAAMVGMLGLQFLYSTGMLEKLDKELGISEGLLDAFGMRTQKEIELSKQLTEALMTEYEARQKARVDFMTADLFGMTEADSEKQIRNEGKRVLVLQQQVDMLTKAKDAWDRLQAARNSLPLDTSFAAPGDADFRSQVADFLPGSRQALADPTASEYTKEFARSVVEMDAALNQFDRTAGRSGFDLTVEGADALAKKLQASNLELKGMQVGLQSLKDISAVHKELLPQFERLREATGKMGPSSAVSDTTGMTSKGSDSFRDMIKSRTGALQEYQAAIEEAVEKETEKLQRMLDRRPDQAGLWKREAQENLDMLAKQAEAERRRIEREIQGLQDIGKLQGEVFNIANEGISLREKEITTLDRLIEKEKERRDVLSDQRSAFEDNAAKRQMSALDRIDDLKAGEQKDKLQSQFGYAQDQLQRMKQRDEEIAQQMAQGMGKGGNKWLSNVGNQIDAYYEMLGQKNKNFLTQEMERADQLANANKQKRLDDLKQQLGGKAQDLTAEAKQAMEGGNLDTASAKLKQAMKTMEELQQAQEKAIGKSSSKQAEQIEKDLKGSSDKMLKLFDMMEEVSKKNQQKLEGQHAEQINKLREIEGTKTAIEGIDIYAPDAKNTLETLKQQLMEIAQIKSQISAIPVAGAGGLAMMGGGGFGGGSTINSTINMNMGGTATPTAAIAAAKAAAASIAMQRA